MDDIMLFTAKVTEGEAGGRTTMHVIHLLPQLSITQTQGRIRAGHRINIIDPFQVLF